MYILVWNDELVVDRKSISKTVLGTRVKQAVPWLQLATTASHSHVYKEFIGWCSLSVAKETFGCSLKYE